MPGDTWMTRCLWHRAVLRMPSPKTAPCSSTLMRRRWGQRILLRLALCCSEGRGGEWNRAADSRSDVSIGLPLCCLGHRSPRSSAPRYGASGHMCGRRLGFRSIRKAQRVTRHKRNSVERGAVRGPLRVMDGGSGRTGSSGCIGGNASGDTGMRFGIHGLGVVERLEG